MILRLVLKRERVEFFGLTLPLNFVGIFSILTMLAFTGGRVCSAIHIDKLIFLIVALSPLVYLVGTTVCARALVKSEIKREAFSWMVFNIVLLAGLIYFSQAFLVEFKITLFGF